MTTERSGPTSQAPCQRDRILELLRERGPAGATNIELNAIAFRYGGRIHELRKRGWKIRTDNLGDGRFRFVLEAAPATRTQPEFLRRPICDELPLFAAAEVR